MTDDHAEHPLHGGNVSAGVVRVGDTVRRPAGPHSPAVQHFLHHLYDVGFRGAPRPLGFDEAGREVLQYVHGEPCWPQPFFDRHLGTPDEVAAVGRLLRELHDASASYVPPPDARWQRLIAPDRAELVVHHDPGPWNLVRATDGGFVLVDWDATAPGSRLWDVAYAAKGVVPIIDETGWRRPDDTVRLRALADGYGLDEDERDQLVALLPRRLRAMHDFLRDQAAAGRQPWRRLWQEGHGAVWARDAALAERRVPANRDAVLGRRRP